MIPTIFPGPREGVDRDDEIARNVEAVGVVRASLSRRAGYDAGPVQLLGSRHDPVLLEAIRQELDENWGRSAIRASLYQPFCHGGARQYLADLLRFHDRECHDVSLQSVEGAIASAFRSPADMTTDVVDCFLRDPVKLRSQALTLLFRAARKNRPLLDRLREVWRDPGFDFEMLWIMAKCYSRLYDAVACRPYLSASECLALLEYQTPGGEQYFVRPDIVPFSATVLEERTADWQRLAEIADSFALAAGDAGADLRESAALAASRGCAIARMAEDPGKGAFRAVIFYPLEPVDEVRPRRQPTHRCRHRERSQPRSGAAYRVLSILAPEPPEWNQYPRTLLPPDSPLRYMKPEA